MDQCGLKRPRSSGTFIGKVINYLDGYDDIEEEEQTEPIISLTIRQYEKPSNNEEKIIDKHEHKESNVYDILD